MSPLGLQSVELLWDTSQSALLSEPRSTWGWPMNAGPVALRSFPGFAEDLLCDVRRVARPL